MEAWDLELGAWKLELSAGGAKSPRSTAIAPMSEGWAAARLRHQSRTFIAGGQEVMLITIAVILLVLWLLGLVSSYTLSGFIHILLVVALVLFIASFVSGRRV